MRVNVRVDLIVLPGMLPVCDLYPLARLDLLEVHRVLAFTIPLRNLHRCVTGEELDGKLIAIVTNMLRTGLPATDEFLEVLRWYMDAL